MTPTVWDKRDVVRFNTLRVKDLIVSLDQYTALTQVIGKEGGAFVYICGLFDTLVSAVSAIGRQRCRMGGRPS